jgi:hypothetical protein
MATSDTSMYDANAVFSFELHKRDAAAIFCSYKRLFRFIVPAHQPVIFFFGEKKEKETVLEEKQAQWTIWSC